MAPTKRSRRGREDRSTGVEERPDRKAFERGVEAVVNYLSALSERDPLDALELRNEVVLRIDTAVGSARRSDDDGESATGDEQVEQDVDDPDDEDAEIADDDAPDLEHEESLTEFEDDEDSDRELDEDDGSDEEERDSEPLDPEEEALLRLVGRKRMRGR